MSDDATVFDLALAQLSIGDYAPIRFEYVMALGATIKEYLYKDGANTLQYSQRYKKFISEYFPQAFEQGYQDGGGSLPPEPNDSAWLSGKIEAERGHATLLFEQLRALKRLAKEEGNEVLEGEAEKRAEGYARTLDAVYSEGKIRGAGNKMLTFGGADGEESCDTCQRLKGQRHRARWWKDKGLIPGQPGNRLFECGGWQCQHILYDDNGSVYNV